MNTNITLHPSFILLGRHGCKNRVLCQSIMDNHRGRDELKVDAVSCPVDDAKRNQFIIIYNINVPIEVFENEQDSRRVLERVKNLLVQDFGQTLVVYQITASYVLVHNLTGATRVWTGSFSARSNVPAQVSGWEDFDPEDFVDQSVESITHVEARLHRHPSVSSNWRLQAMISIIFNCQSKVESTSLVLRTFPHHGKRTQRTFSLP